jgi:hypothetical protein
MSDGILLKEHETVIRLSGTCENDEMYSYSSNYSVAITTGVCSENDIYTKFY